MAPKRKAADARDAGELYRMSTFSRLTGVPAELLRAWERRHQLLEPERSDGGHRAYTQDDLRVIERVRALLESGRSIGEVARIGRTRLLEQARAKNVDPRDIASPNVLRDRLVEAARQLDDREIERTLDEAFAVASPLAAVEQVLVPAAQRAGDLWATGELSVASEHMLSAALGYRLRKLIELASASSDARSTIICACFPEEGHELGLLVVALHLASTGRRVSYLGAALPAEDLERAIIKLEPRTVCLSVTHAVNFTRHKSEIIRVARTFQKSSVIYIGGLGVPKKDGALARAGIRTWHRESNVSGFIAALPR